MSAETELLGFTSKVHKSLVSEDRLYGVPYMSALANGLMWGILALTFQSVRPVIVGIVVHAVIALMTRGDIYRLTLLFLYLLYRAFYGRRATR